MNILVEGQYNKAEIFSELRDEKAIQQIREMCNDPLYKDGVIKVMPDYHPGAGCTIGLTMKLPRNAVVNPNFVGVDISCGLLAIKLSKKPNLQDLDDICHRNVPSGFYGHKEPVSEKAQEYIDSLYKKLNDPYKLVRQLGSLGSGNHFIELDQSGNDYYLVIHSGSRNAGLQVATEYFKDFENNCLDMESYLHDILIMRDYAHDNRMIMAQIIMKRLKIEPVEIIESVHNYIEVNDDNIIIRKGAISAKQNEKCIIPLNMRDGTIIGTGKSNENWNCSAPHGAGRVLSRSEAKSKISLDKFEQSMKGIYSTTVCKGTLDEAPMAYKPKKYILDQIDQTIDIIDVMKPIYNFKAVTEKRKK